MIKIANWLKKAMSLDEAYRLFNLDRKSFDLNELKKTYREYVKMYHPDHGGDQKKMSIINQARDLIENHILSMHMNPETYDVQSKSDLLKEMTERSNNIEDQINNIKNIWIKFLNRYVKGTCHVTIDKNIDSIYFVLIVTLKFDDVSFEVRVKSFNTSGKTYLNYNSKMKYKNQIITLISENNRRITAGDLDKPEYFFPEKKLHHYFPIIISDDYEIAERNKVISVLKDLGAVKINENSYQIFLNDGNYVVVKKEVGKLIKTPTWTLYGIYDKKHNQKQQLVKPYIETFNKLNMGKNILQMVEDIKKLKVSV